MAAWGDARLAAACIGHKRKMTVAYETPNLQLIECYKGKYKATARAENDDLNTTVRARGVGRRVIGWRATEASVAHVAAAGEGRGG